MNSYMPATKILPRNQPRQPGHSKSHIPSAPSFNETQVVKMFICNNHNYSIVQNAFNKMQVILLIKCNERLIHCHQLYQLNFNFYRHYSSHCNILLQGSKRCLSLSLPLFLSFSLFLSLSISLSFSLYLYVYLF